MSIAPAACICGQSKGQVLVARSCRGSVASPTAGPCHASPRSIFVGLFGQSLCSVSVACPCGRPEGEPQRLISGACVDGNRAILDRRQKPATLSGAPSSGHHQVQLTATKPGRVVTLTPGTIPAPGDSQLLVDCGGEPRSDHRR